MKTKYEISNRMMERVESAQIKALNKVVSVRLSKALDVKAQLKLNPLDSTG